MTLMSHTGGIRLQSTRLQSTDPEEECLDTASFELVLQSGQWRQLPYQQEEHLETATEPTTESSKTTGGNVKSMEPAEVMRERFPVEEARERRDGARSSKDSAEAVRDTAAEQVPSSQVAGRTGEKAGARGS